MTIPGSANSLLLASKQQYLVQRSIRFNSSDSAYLSRTPSSAGNRKTWTWSGWVKRSAPALNTIFGVDNGGGTSAGLIFSLSTASSEKIEFFQGGTAYRITTQVFRDFSAWYHIVLALDTTAATANNRIRLYVNGSEVTAFDTLTNPTQNADLPFNNTVTHSIGSDHTNTGPRWHFSGYLAEIHFIDGQALTPSSFTETSATTGQLIPKKYTGTFTGNSFWLPFSDNSSTTSGSNVGIGKDFSGLGNYWNTTNLSVTAGAGNDSLVDTPTSYGTDTGAGGEVRGNYATWNPLLKGQTGTPIYSNGNLDASATGNWAAVGGTVGIESGKWYWETTITAVGSSNQSCIGLLRTIPSFFLGYDSNSWGYFSDARKFNAGSGVAYGSSYGLNDVIGVAFDRDNGTLVFYKNGVSQGTAYTGLTSGVYFPATSHVDSSTSATNFGQRPFAYTAPSGFKALVDTNLPTPVVAKPETVFQVIRYTGNGSTQTIPNVNTVPTTLGFSPDFVWLKSRTNANWHELNDTVRTAGKILYSNATDAEVTAGRFTAFTNDGFSVSTTGGDGTNFLNAAMVAWCWDAGSTTTTISANAYSAGVPSITSSVRANASAGFSIVTYTGNNTTGATIGHGLNAIPQFIITFKRGGGREHAVWHSGLSSSGTLYLANTYAAATYPNRFDVTGFTSSVYKIGSNANTVNEADNYVAYCWAPVSGYSSFGSYVGNGSTNGPFVFTGMRPRWLLIKASSAVGFGSWRLFDTARDTYNVCGNQLMPNLSDAEYGPGVTGTAVDILSNGFKLRDTFEAWNANGSTYIYAAFAESPFQYARAR